MKIVKIYAAVSGFTPERQLGVLENTEYSKLSAKLRKVWKAGVFPADEVKPTASLRKSVYETLFKYGVIGMDGGWSVAPENAIQALEEVKALQRRHDDYRSNLVRRWDGICRQAVLDFEEQFTALPEAVGMAADVGMSTSELREKLSAMLQKRQPSVGAVSSKLRFSYSVKVYENMVEGEDALSQALKASLDQESVDLYGQMIKDTAKQADEMFSLLTAGGDNSKAVNRRTLRKGEELLVNKVRSLGFIDPRLVTLAAGVEKVLAPLVGTEKTKTLRVGECGELLALLAVLSNEERLKKRLEVIQHGDSLVITNDVEVVVDTEDEVEEVQAAPSTPEFGTDVSDEEDEPVLIWA